MTENTNTFFFIDTNILVYAYDQDEGEKHHIAKTLLDKCWDQELTYTLSTQILSEFFVVITKKLKKPLSIDAAKQIIHDIISFPSFIKFSITFKTVEKAIEIHALSKCPYYDSLIAAIMFENGISHIYTENTKDFSKIAGIKAVNPFKR